MININQLKLHITHTNDDLLLAIKKASRLESLTMDRVTILRKSIDARKKDDIHFVYNVAIDYDNEKKFSPNIKKAKEGTKRPIVVGFGPAGLFASYILAINGLKPIILERGKSIDERIKDVKKFFDTMELDENSNVSFGEGGAGAFSDGKLNTNNKDRLGIYRFVLETFVKYGADKSILYENNPHIGTDKLTGIIKNMRDDIISLGAEIRYNTIFSYDDYKEEALSGTPIILAIGNSARDTFRDLLKNGFDLKAKAFAVGFRVAHKQKMIDKNQYGKFSKYCKTAFDDTNSKSDENKATLPPATYKLTYDCKNGHSIYSFCMCPGGYIINSSNYKNMLSINGMSYNDRAGMYANSAIVETIKPEELNIHQLKNANNENPLICLEFQELVEKEAFALNEGYIPYSGDTDDTENIFKGKAKKNEDIVNIYEKFNLHFSIKNDIEKALKHFEKILPGFDNEKVVVAGVETRTSSPVMLARDDKYMCNVKNFYPCGEGLGHGGGIMSCAVDGIMVAESIVKSL